MRKFLSLLLAVVMLCSAFKGLQVTSFAAALPSSGSCGEDVKYSFNSSTGKLVISGNGAMSDYEWEESPFYNQLAIKSVVINNGVNAIGDETFRDCSGITSIVISGSVTSIGEAAFYGCESLTSITIPASIESIGSGAFSCCQNLTSFAVPNNVKIIGFETFSRCYNLESIILPDSLEIIEHSAFEDCRNLKHITIPNSVTSIGDCAFFDCNSLASVTIPNSVLSIGARAFLGCSALTSISIPNSVTSIGEAAFEHCTGLTSITIPESVTRIDICSFAGCNNLTSIQVSEQNQVFDSRDNCNAIIKTATNTLIMGCQNTVIPESVTCIGEGAFEHSGFTSMTIPESVISIGWCAFDNCDSLADIYYTGTRAQWNKIDIEEEGNYCLYYVNIHFGGSNTDENYCGVDITYTIEGGTLTLSGRGSTWGYSTGVGDYSPFYNNTNIREVVIEDGISEIGSDLFYGCSSIEKIYLPSTMGVLGQGCFWGCSALTELTIPEGVYSIESYAFVDCTALQDVYYEGSEEAWNEIEIGDENDNLLNTTIHYDYFPESGQIGDNITYFFEKDTGIVTISGIGTIWNYNWDEKFPFESDSITKVIIGSGVTSIGEYTFCCCGLTSITIPDSVTKISDMAFDGCHSLTDIYYTGTQEQWNQIDVDERWNGVLIDANLHLNTQPVHTHEYVSAITTPATCTEPGVMTYTCICGEKHTDVIPATGHKSIVLNAVEPTCTKTGLTEGEKCSVCGEMIKAQKTINALGHDYTEDVTAPTCTQYGYTTYTCSRCWDSYIGDIVSAKQHRSAAAVKENEKSATCTATGSYDEVVYCSDCGAEISRTKQSVPALGHDYKVTVTKPTATKLGYTTHTCANCGCKFVDTYKAPTGKVSGFKCASRTSTAEKFTWTKTSGVNGYQVQLLNSAGKSAGTATTTGTAYTFSKLTAGSAYKARVRFYITKDGKNYYGAWSTITSPTLPAGSAISKLTPAKKAFTAHWKKASVTGYQLQYATNAKFTKATTKTVKGAAKVKLAVKSLKGGAKYFVRVRTYKTIGGKNYYSAWSGAKAVTTKK